MHQGGEQQINLLQNPPNSKTELYSQLTVQVKSLLAHEEDFVANMANCAALLYHTLPHLNWVGFYILREDVLVVGPFQGKPACVRIPLGKGVCGTAAEHQETIRVDNVRQYPGHIACDEASQSEIVIPLLKDGRLIGVLDLDSPILDRFDAEDAAGLEQIVAIFIELTNIHNKPDLSQTRMESE